MDTSISKLTYFFVITNSLEYLDIFFPSVKKYCNKETNQEIDTFPFKVRLHIWTVGTFIMSHMDKQVFIHYMKCLVVQEEALGCGAV